MTNNQTCTLCGTETEEVLFQKKDVRYLSCAECGLVFMDPGHWPSIKVERERYSEHNNDGNDAGYVEHLMDIGGRVRAALQEGAEGLDYGCGTSPVMAQELQKTGVQCASYDPIFADSRDLLRKEYDFLTCCEAFEHFHRPGVEMLKLYNVLKPNGVLGIKTSLITDGIDYERWYYANDWTHVCFLRERTVEWLAKRFHMEILENDNGRIVLKRTPSPRAVKVVAGVVERDAKYLIAKRAAGKSAGRWEFPGGKIAGDELPAEALHREIMEEMGLRLATKDVVSNLLVPADTCWLELVFVRADSAMEPAALNAHSEWQWADVAELCQLDLLEGDRAFTDMCLTPA